MFNQILKKFANFQNRLNITKYHFLWSKMTLSRIISTKTTKSPGKSSVRTGLDQTIQHRILTLVLTVFIEKTMGNMLDFY
jgi:hypothetical protein